MKTGKIYDIIKKKTGGIAVIGAIIGDIAGSRFEFDNIKTKKFDLFHRSCDFTDDTVMTLAVGKALIGQKPLEAPEAFKKHLVETMHEVGGRYPYCGYGGNFVEWIVRRRTTPYNSFGNGSAMRVSAAGWAAASLREAEEIAKLTAEVSHNHPEGIKGAQAVAASIFLARWGKDKGEIKRYITEKYYKIDFTLDEIRPYYDFDVTCQGSVPQALEAFFESTSFEDAIRNAISIGGDSDTIAAIAGSVAEAYYNIDKSIRETALSFLDGYLLGIFNEAEKALIKG